MNKIYGYMRVSSMEQNEDRQMVALKQAGVAAGNIFMDKQSGKDFHRTNYEKMVSLSQDDYCGFGNADTVLCGGE